MSVEARDLLNRLALEYSAVEELLALVRDNELGEGATTGLALILSRLNADLFRLAETQ